ncbi:hypothetical protein PENTCL1PPCAC_12413 [Pristionchus entomophagus]|uniref:BPTI/Kunitz inhibitor domain-containing protein n=1 Tax=Pristionchus entomophagus TaxID=358040 RepID=A0AAV5TBP5_9BILA|nr:hypothetical protein PENTCL1PPCAC_12413 [Pristionchus entomophagus]
MRCSLYLFPCLLVLIECTTTTTQATTMAKNTTKNPTTKTPTTPPPLKCYIGKVAFNESDQSRFGELPVLTECPINKFEQEYQHKCCTTVKYTHDGPYGGPYYRYNCSFICDGLGDKDYVMDDRFGIMPSPPLTTYKGYYCRGAVGPCKYEKLRCYEGKSTINHTALPNKKLPKLIDCPRSKTCCKKFKSNEAFQFECSDDCPEYGDPEFKPFVLTETVKPYGYKTVCRGAIGPCDVKKPPPVIQCFVGRVSLNNTAMTERPLPTLQSCSPLQSCCVTRVHWESGKTNGTIYDCASNCPDFLNMEYRDILVGSNLFNFTSESYCRQYSHEKCKYVKP